MTFGPNPVEFGWPRTIAITFCSPSLASMARGGGGFFIGHAIRFKVLSWGTFVFMMLQGLTKKAALLYRPRHCNCYSIEKIIPVIIYIMSSSPDLIFMLLYRGMILLIHTSSLHWQRRNYRYFIVKNFLIILPFYYVPY